MKLTYLKDLVQWVNLFKHNIATATICKDSVAIILKRIEIVEYTNGIMMIIYLFASNLTQPQLSI